MSLEKQDEFLAAFQIAVMEGKTTELSSLLSSDIQLSADGGGKVPTIRDTLYGKNPVLTFLSKALRGYWAGHTWELVDINGARGVVLKEEGATVATVSFAYDRFGRATGIYIMRNPDKLTNLSAIAIH